MINIILDEKPTSISIRYNAYYKLVILLSIINHCAYSKKADLNLIHLVFWSLRDEKNYKILLDLADQNRKTLVPWSFEYGIDQVLALWYINDFLERKIVSGTLEIKITNTGLAILKSIDNLELFTQEIEKIKALGKIPKKRLQEANKNWKLI